jgi:hypothetical protein
MNNSKVKWLILTLFLTIAYKGQSQTGQINTDNSKIVLNRPTAITVLEGLYTFDTSREKINILNTQINVLDIRINLKDKQLRNLELQIQELNKVYKSTENQFKIQQKLSKDLQLALKKEKFKTKLFSIGAPALLIGALLIK